MYAGTAIPQVTVLDRYGKILSTCVDRNRNRVMGQLDQIIKSGAAK